MKAIVTIFAAFGLSLAHAESLTCEADFQKAITSARSEDILTAETNCSSDASKLCQQITSGDVKRMCLLASAKGVNFALTEGRGTQKCLNAANSADPTRRSFYNAINDCYEQIDVCFDLPSAEESRRCYLNGEYAGYMAAKEFSAGHNH